MKLNQISILYTRLNSHEKESENYGESTPRNNDFSVDAVKRKV